MEFISLTPLWWLLVPVLIGVAYWFTLSDRPKWWRRLSFAFRCLALVCVILALCGPYLNKPSKAIHVAHLVDVSESVDLEECIAAMQHVIEMNEQLHAGDSSAVFIFADGAREVDPEDALQTLETWCDTLADDQFRRETRLAAALRSARLSFPAGKAHRVVLYSDGVPTTDPVENELKRLEKEGALIQFEQLRRESRPEAAVVEVVPSAHAVYAGERLRLKTRLTANVPMKAKVRLLNRGVARASQEVELTPEGDNRFAFDVVVGMDDAPVWQVELVPEQDHFPLNNQAGCEVAIIGRARVLVLHEKPRSMRHFRSALEKQGFGVEVRAPIGLPATLDELLKFDAIVLADIPATDIPERAMHSLKRYVTDFGGGLLMLGSENSFGLGGYYQTPVEEVLPITSRFEKEKETPSMAMALVIDKSGSMSGVPIELARQAAKATVELLGPRDKIGVIGFDSQPFIACEMTPASDVGRVQDAIDSLQAGGGTSIYPGMVEGERMLRSAGTRVRHMILLTDGQSAPGDAEGISESMALSGITVSTVALGGGAARELLKRIAQIGRGRYYETMDPSSVPRIFTKETMAVSRSAIKEEPFIPVAVNTLGFLEGVDFDDAPYLLGYVMTRLKPAALIHLITEGGDPLLASGQYGLGVGMAFTSDASDMWAGEWVEWKGFGPFWAQILRRCVRKDRGAGIAVRTSEEPTGLRLWVERRDAGLRPVNEVDWNGVALMEYGGEQLLEPRQVGLGRYEVFLPMKEKQNSSIRLLDQETGATRLLSWRRDYPEEYRLSSVADAGIAALPALDADTLTQRDDAVWRYVSVRHTFVFLAMLFAVLGVLFRRLG
ncbi:VWA domain-containing protein [Pontiellaceae bacterium B1224]|nr:VWA domain-containing protein [Pontiellaceae bacterium B1224]